MANHNVSRAMSTQHPDNVTQPFFSDSSEIGGEDEIKEVFYAFSHIGCLEQLWDCEGKEVDNFVVKKLLTKYEPYFSKNTLGKDVFLTLRVPNPAVERNEAKILLETLESIPRNFDTANLFYNKDVAPIFEVALPMTTSHEELVRIAEYYRKHVVGKQNSSLGSMSVSEWIGKFRPESLRLIPLMEEKDSILRADEITEKYMEAERISDYQRVWLARSDPALNYGNLATVLLLKIAFQRLHALQEKTSVDILPILGCGSAPFRGNFKPTNVRNCLEGYPSVHTFTLQSAFKYDYKIDDVTSAVKHLNETRPSKPTSVDEGRLMEIIGRLVAEYQKQVTLVVGAVNNISPYIPSRRKRKLHIGLFGYSRNINGLHLPRAITFCASMYSYGLPPELLGMNALTENDIDYVIDIYPNFENDMRDSMIYLNRDNMKLFPGEIGKVVEGISERFGFEPDEKHGKVTSIIADDLARKNQSLRENITRAGFIRGFLG